MASSVEQAKAKVRAWTEAHRQAVLYDEAGSTLLDVPSGKSVPLPWRDVTAFEEKIHPETGETYLILVFENENQIVLSDPGGVAFPSSDRNTGPLPDLPPVVCLKDFHTLKRRIDHHLHAHRDEAPPRECLDLVMISIAILDGARLAGFEVSDLERELDQSLQELERRRP